MFFCTSATTAADFEALIKDCNDCHGNDGVSEWSDVPTIAGVSAFVVSDAMYFYRDEDRLCDESKCRQGDTERPVDGVPARTIRVQQGRNAFAAGEDGS